MSSSSSALPAPITTELSGSSARNTGRPVSSLSSASKPFKSASPPASTMPRSAMSPGELGGRALERTLHRLDDGVDRLGERVADLVGADGQRAQHAGDQIAPLDVHCQHFVARVGVADGHLDQLGRALADEQVVSALDVDTMPMPRTWMSVFAVPRSIARS